MCGKLTAADVPLPGRTTGHGETDSESDGEEINRWNLRKCSAAGLDVLSTVFGEELLPIVTPIVQQRLQVRAPPSADPVPPSPPGLSTASTQVVRTCA